MIREAFCRLETTPGQEKAIVQALHELKDTLRDVHAPLRDVRKGVGQAIAGAAFDESAWGEADQKVQAAGQRAREAIHVALGKIHAALDERQRERLSRWIQSGPCHGW